MYCPWNIKEQGCWFSNFVLKFSILLSAINEHDLLIQMCYIHFIQLVKDLFAIKTQQL